MSYEFTTEENKVFNALFFRYLIIGLLIALTELIYLLKLDTLGGIEILSAIIVIGGAILFVLPFFKFRTIVLTEGEDVEELMKALKGVAMAFMVVGILVVINLVVMIINL